jgi:hypothetical protein
MSRAKHIDYPSAQHFRAQAASIRLLAVAITSPALLKRMEEKARDCDRKATDLERLAHASAPRKNSENQSR